MDRIGFLAEAAHPVFWPVAERLAARGFDVTFVDPTDPVPRAVVDDLDALVNTTLRRTTLSALRYADRRGVETWNGFVPSSALGARLVALTALERLGCQVPEIHLEEPAAETGTYRRRSTVRWDAPAGDRDAWRFYQRRVSTEPRRHVYFAVDDGRETHVRAKAVRTELSGLAELVADVDVDVALAARVRELSERFGARSLRVDFVPTDDGPVAVDVDPAPSFSGTLMDRRIADSVASLTTIGA